jgi:hypothetical protein
VGRYRSSSGVSCTRRDTRQQRPCVRWNRSQSSAERIRLPMRSPRLVVDLFKFPAEAWFQRPSRALENDGNRTWCSIRALCLYALWVVPSSPWTKRHNASTNGLNPDGSQQIGPQGVSILVNDNGAPIKQHHWRRTLYGAVCMGEQSARAKSKLCCTNWRATLYVQPGVCGGDGSSDVSIQDGSRRRRLVRVSGHV